MVQIVGPAAIAATLVDQTYQMDLSVVQAARVSLRGTDQPASSSERDAGLIKRLIRDGHGSPFEHNAVTFAVQAPIFVAREFVRHRHISYNEISGRYAKMPDMVYVPDQNRPIVQFGKAMSYTLSEDPYLAKFAGRVIQNQAESAFKAYNMMLTDGVAKEVARMVLPVSAMTNWYATMNLRALMHFLDLRLTEEALFEIQVLAKQMEATFATIAPMTYDAWSTNVE